jgi:hypothetical protein
LPASLQALGWAAQLHTTIHELVNIEKASHVRVQQHKERPAMFTTESIEKTTQDVKPDGELQPWHSRAHSHNHNDNRRDSHSRNHNHNHIGHNSNINRNENQDQNHNENIRKQNQYRNHSSSSKAKQRRKQGRELLWRPWRGHRNFFLDFKHFGIDTLYLWKMENLKINQKKRCHFATQLLLSDNEKLAENPDS